MSRPLTPERAGNCRDRSGLAALTEPVGERPDALTVIELDRDLAARLQTHPFLGPKLTIYQQDAMTMNFGELSQTMGQPRVFGNLPYNISTPLMFHLFSYTDAIADMHFMLQKRSSIARLPDRTARRMVD